MPPSAILPDSDDYPSTRRRGCTCTEDREQQFPGKRADANLAIFPYPFPRSHPPASLAEGAGGFQSSNLRIASRGRHPPQPRAASHPGLAWPHLPPTAAPSCSEPAHWPLKSQTGVGGHWSPLSEASAQRKDHHSTECQSAGRNLAPDHQCHVAVLARSQRPPTTTTTTTTTTTPTTPQPSNQLLSPVASRLLSACCSLCLVRPRLQAQPCP